VKPRRFGQDRRDFTGFSKRSLSNSIMKNVMMVIFVTYLVAFHAMCARVIGDVVEVPSSIDPQVGFDVEKRRNTATTVPSPTTNRVLHDGDDTVGKLVIQVVKIGKDGREYDLHVQGIELVCESARWSMGFVLDATSVAISLGTEFNGRLIKANECYYVRGFPLRPVFHVPPVKQGDEVRVRLVVDDERIQPPVTPAPKPSAQKIALRGRVDAPDIIAAGERGLAVAYGTGRSGRWWVVEPDGSFGGDVESLGQEMGLFDRSKPGGVTAIFYTPAVTKASPVFPADAAIDGRGDGVRKLTVDFANVKLPEGAVAVGSLFNAKSTLPLCTRSLPTIGTTVEVVVPFPFGETVIFVGSKKGEYFKCDIDLTDNPDGPAKVKSLETFVVVK